MEPSLEDNVISPSYYGVGIPTDVLGEFGPDFDMLAVSSFV